MRSEATYSEPQPLRFSLHSTGGLFLQPTLYAAQKTYPPLDANSKEEGSLSLNHAASGHLGFLQSPMFISSLSDLVWQDGSFPLLGEEPAC